jgi:hypothetical protein
MSSTRKTSATSKATKVATQAAAQDIPASPASTLIDLATAPTAPTSSADIKVQPSVISIPVPNVNTHVLRPYYFNEPQLPPLQHAHLETIRNKRKHIEDITRMANSNVYFNMMKLDDVKTEEEEINRLDVLLQARRKRLKREETAIKTNVNIIMNGVELLQKQRSECINDLTDIEKMLNDTNSNTMQLQFFIRHERDALNNLQVQEIRGNAIRLGLLS